ncbi:MAG: efflux RND transporter periplasmic adaptor subunit [Desulfobulbaceae bacterium]|nr:efflux RND transporter periplasmic adaptor subunit [Desulfobulbaceae bacterium]
MSPQALLRKYKKVFIWLAALAAAAILLRLTVLGPERVRVVRAERRDLVARVYGNGTVEAKVVVNLASKITGRVREVAVDQGDTVRQGQLLALLDDGELREQVRQGEAGAAKAAAAMGLEAANLKKARATLALAEKNARRFGAMAAGEVVARIEAEQYETAFEVAREEVARATAALAAAGQEKDAAVAGVAVIRSRFADTRILAPTDGIIIRRELEPGATVTAGLPIFRLADPRTVWVKANVDESQLKGVVPGQPAEITLRSAPGEKLPGRVARLARESDRVTEDLEVNVAFTPVPAMFHLGEQAEVLITSAVRPAALSLPAAALASREGRRGVWTVAAGRLRFREIGVGIEDQRGWVEVTGPLAGNEMIVVADPVRRERFHDGQRVRVGK